MGEQKNINGYSWGFFAHPFTRMAKENKTIIKAICSFFI
jgi:hypothetical protein